MGRRLLVAGDKSHAGKSTISLGLLGALLEAGYAPSELAYIKPATQCVSSTLTARFCEANGIDYMHVGPVVFYRGFTRSYLDAAAEAVSRGGSAPDGSELVAKCSAAVEKLSKDKKIIIIDGVGYPSVGSIVGCSSADLALACAAPVLLVGKPGVGDAIDSFNLCARYFEAQRIPVLGAIFNKAPLKGFYGRDSCDRYIRQYFACSRPHQRVYGVLPAAEGLDTGAEESCSFAYRHPEAQPDAGPMTEADLVAMKRITELFHQYVDVKNLLEDLETASENPASYCRPATFFPGTSNST